MKPILLVPPESLMQLESRWKIDKKLHYSDILFQDILRVELESGCMFSIWGYLGEACTFVSKKNVRRVLWPTSH